MNLNIKEVIASLEAHITELETMEMRERNPNTVCVLLERSAKLEMLVVRMQELLAEGDTEVSLMRLL